ncbi:hypothetical protein [Formosa maritima]|uniref:Lysoplasmalogenase n=1 Tax=Formosa maritima TaxID=2592046 RepID=A0A5D0GHG2_9FLAO|nr:hypothetical protein [Formosa maritima]TYA57257.1 hypothetical protein FVF61_04950 [Formosa maritima]
MIQLVISTFILEIVNSNIYEVLELLIVPLLTITYLIRIKDKSLLFALFLVTYSVSDLINIIDQDRLYEIIYFTCNCLYILSYIFLLLEVLKTINLKTILKRFPAHFIVLLLLNLYIIFVMATIINPIDFETNHLSLVRIIEHLYNFVLLSLLSMSFLNYLLHEDTKSLLMFCGCLAITFSELLLIGYYYLSEQMLALGFVSTLLNICAFILFYYQSTLKPKANNSNSLANKE